MLEVDVDSLALDTFGSESQEDKERTPRVNKHAMQPSTIKRNKMALHTELPPEEPEHDVGCEPQEETPESTSGYIHSILASYNSPQSADDDDDDEDDDSEDVERYQNGRHKHHDIVPSPPDPYDGDDHHHRGNHRHDKAVVKATIISENGHSEEVGSVNLNDIYSSARNMTYSDNDEAWRKTWRSDQITCAPILCMAGLIVTVLLASGLIVYFTSRGNDQDDAAGAVMDAVEQNTTING